MGECSICDGDDQMSYTCNECGDTYCSRHRLPENHRCRALLSKSQGGWFDEKLSVRKQRQSQRIVRNHRDTQEVETETPDNSHETNDGEEPETACIKCGRITQRECRKCERRYCVHHKSPQVHDCPDFNVSETDSDSSESEQQHRSSRTPPKPDFRGGDAGSDSGLLSTAGAWLRRLRFWS